MIGLQMDADLDRRSKWEVDLRDEIVRRARTAAASEGGRCRQHEHTDASRPVYRVQ